MPSPTSKPSKSHIRRSHPTSFQRRLITETTPLLAAVTDHPFAHHGRNTSPDETIQDDELEETESESETDTEIDANEFDQMLTKSISYSSGLGMEPESQESPMMRGERRRSVSFARRSIASVRGIGGVDEEDGVGKSPFLGGIGVGRFWLIYMGILSNLFVAVFDMTILASSHPVITSYFHSSNSASWLSTAFLLTSTAFQPLFGRLSDTMGRKPPYIFTLTIFLLSTIWCGVARSMTEFIIARAFCGVGAGGTLVMGSIITSDLVPIEIRGTYQSYINIVYGLGTALGAASGGAIADTLGWRWEFGCQVPFLAICLVIAIFTTPRTLGMKAGAEQDSLRTAMRKFDYKGSLLMTTSVTSLVLGLNLGGNIYPWTHPLVLIPLLTFTLAFPLFLYIESLATLPIMPLKLLLHSPRSNLLFSNFLASLIVNSILFNIPLYFQAVLLTTATTSGLRLLVPTCSAAAAGISTGFLITRFQRIKWPVVTGAAFIFLGTVCLASMDRHLHTWTYLLFLVPAAMGQGFQFPGTFIALLSVSERDDQAVVTSTLTLWRSLGMVLGVSGSSLVLQNGLVVYLDRFVSGDDKAGVIEEVRRSIQAITRLPPLYQGQVVEAYAASLRVTFVVTAVLGLVSLFLVVPIRIPRLGKRF